MKTSMFWLPKLSENKLPLYRMKFVEFSSHKTAIRSRFLKIVTIKGQSGTTSRPRDQNNSPPFAHS